MAQRSGWLEDEVEENYDEIVEVEPFAGNSYIPLPKALINVKNADNKCFRWALKSARFPIAKNPERPSRYPANDGLYWEGVVFPMEVAKIGDFEKKNGLAINVFGWEEDLAILRVSKENKAIPRINLMLIKEEEK